MTDRPADNRRKAFVLDTNVLIHDPNALLNFEEHQILIPMTVLEELDKLKSGKASVSAECRAAIRMIDRVLGSAEPEQIRQGVPIWRDAERKYLGTLSVLMDQPEGGVQTLANSLNDNKIINLLVSLQVADQQTRIVLVTKDINMRLKARACGLASEDYTNDQLVSDVKQLSRGYAEFEGSFWERFNRVETVQAIGETRHYLRREDWSEPVFANQFVVDEQGFIGRVLSVSPEQIVLRDMNHERLMNQEVWGLRPHNIHQAMALDLLRDPSVHLVSLTGPAGSGKTILALATAIEQSIEEKRFNKIIATRSTPPLAEEHGFLPGTDELPPAPSGVVTVVGRVRQSQTAGIGKPSDDGTQTLTQIRRVDLQALSQQFDQTVQPVYLDLLESSPAEADGMTVEGATLEHGLLHVDVAPPAQPPSATASATVAWNRISTPACAVHWSSTILKISWSTWKRWRYL